MIGMIPEGLILLTSVALLAGVVKLGKRQTLVQELFGIESLARVDVLCVDKTGTLTTGEMTLDETIPMDADEAELNAAAARFLGAFEAASGTLRALADAIPAAENTALATLPFSSARKKSAASFSDGTTLILGAPSFVLDAVPARVTEASEQGYRVLALAEAEGAISGTELPPVRRCLGLFLLRDTLRPSVKDTLAWFSREGVSVRVLSGDDPRTVSAVARTLKLPGADRIADCSLLSDDELRAAAADKVIFGRLTPARKQILVEALKAEGHSVAMTGDGVNDIPSLKAADCSIAIGGGAEATEHAWHDGYYHTGDTAWVDEAGYYWYVGRTDDLIKSSGYRIGPFEVENAIMELPYVLECAVVGVPDPTRGQLVKAYIVLTKDKQPSEELKKEIQDYVKKNTAPYKYPRKIDFLTELPKTVSGKIRRSALRALGDQPQS
jgi:magnesium-transporting ATPase (P-type)